MGLRPRHPAVPRDLPLASRRFSRLPRLGPRGRGRPHPRLLRRGLHRVLRRHARGVPRRAGAGQPAPRAVPRAARGPPPGRSARSLLATGVALAPRLRRSSRTSSRGCAAVRGGVYAGRGLAEAQRWTALSGSLAAVPRAGACCSAPPSPSPSRWASRPASGGRRARAAGRRPPRGTRSAPSRGRWRSSRSASSARACPPSRARSSRGASSGGSRSPSAGRRSSSTAPARARPARARPRARRRSPRAAVSSCARSSRPRPSSARATCCGGPTVARPRDGRCAPCAPTRRPPRASIDDARRRAHPLHRRLRRRGHGPQLPATCACWGTCPLLASARAENVLVIAFGTGTTAGAVAAHAGA